MEFRIYNLPLNKKNLLTSILFKILGIVNYKIDFLGAIDNSTVECSAELSDREGNVVATARDCSGTLTVASPKLWWAFLMDPDPGYLYKLKVNKLLYGLTT